MKNKYSSIIFLGALLFSVLFLILSRLSLNEFLKPTSPLEEKKSSGFFYHIDDCNINSRFALISGWAGYIDGGIDTVTNIYVVDINGGLHKIQKTTIRRSDIVQEKDNNEAFEHSGFSASLSVSKDMKIANKFAIESVNNNSKSMVYYDCK